MALTRQLINNNIYEGTYIKNIGNFGSVSIPLLSNAPIKFNYNIGDIENNSKIYVGFILGNMSKPVLIPDKVYIDSIMKNPEDIGKILSNYYTKLELKEIVEDSHTHENKYILDNIKEVVIPKTLSVDSEVIQNSNNVVTSGAVYNYVVQKLSENDIIKGEIATIDDLDTSMFEITE